MPPLPEDLARILGLKGVEVQDLTRYDLEDLVTAAQKFTRWQLKATEYVASTMSAGDDDERAHNRYSLLWKMASSKIIMHLITVAHEERVPCDREGFRSLRDVDRLGEEASSVLGKHPNPQQIDNFVRETLGLPKQELLSLPLPATWSERINPPRHLGRGSPDLQ